MLAIQDTGLYDVQEDETSARQGSRREPVIRLSIVSATSDGGLNFPLMKSVKPVPPLKFYPTDQDWARAPVSLEPSAAERPAILIEVQPDLSALAHGLTVLPLSIHLKPQTQP